VIASTISFNSAVSTTDGAAGGGVFSSPTSTATITNSTVSGNYAISTAAGATAHGGGLDLSETAGVIINSTLSGNSASSGGAALLAWDTVTVRGSLIANSLLSENCAVFADATDGGGNQSDDDSCGTIPDSLSGLDPVLRDNGGPTRTHALLDGTSAIDVAGSCGLFNDQRGAPRFGVCDAGSFEWGGCPEILLSEDTVLAAEEYEACRIWAGANYYVVGPFGDLTLRAGRVIELGDGFTVGLDAALTLEMDADLIP